MDERWLRKAPAFSTVGRVAADRRAGRKRIMVVIPTRGRAVLKDHLERLSRQTSKDFDVAVVCGREDPLPPAPPGLTLVHLECRENYGSAGGFYAGERFALDEGYDMVVLADDDCLPSSDDLLERLEEATRGSAIALPKISYGDLAPAPGSLISHYGCVRSSALRNCGLTFAPFFFGGEDIELLERLVSSGCALAQADACVTHPRFPSSMLTPPQKTFYYIRGGILAKYLGGSFLKTFSYNLFFLSGSAYLAFLDPLKSRVYFDAATYAAGMRFFSCALFRERENTESAPRTGAVEIKKRVRWIPETRTDLSWYIRIVAGRLAALALSFPDAARVWGREIVFDDGVGVAAIPLLLSARRAYIRSEGKWYIVCNNRGFWIAPLIGALLLLMLPLFIGASFCLTCAGFMMKAWTGADSRGYGVRR